MSKPLDDSQLATLRKLPLGAQPNKLRFAIAISGCKQLDIAEARSLSPSQVSNAVNGKGVTSVETAREIAAFFHCPIELLWPPADGVAEPELPFSGAERRAGEERRKVPA